MATSEVSPKGTTHFNDLPLETQKGIFRHVSTADLLSLQRVSHHFFSLATAEIYRDLDFNFTSSDALHNGTPHSRTADAVQTVVASDRNYGLHIRSFRLGISEETSNNALLMSRVLWDSAADPSKVLNTVILLMVRQAGMMESFQWDTPIELNGRVYQALHKISTLRHLRIRLDVPASMKTTVHQTFPPTPQITTTHIPSSQLQSAYSMASTLPAPSSLPGAKLRKMQKKKTSTYDYWANGRAFSGFSHLCSLTLLGLSSLDSLGEICDCLKASSTSLRSLTLSLSSELARKARQPSATNPHADDASDTDPDGDDEEEMNDAQLPNSNNSGQPVNEADIRKEKLAQEAILARIFDLQAVAAEGKRLEKTVGRPIASRPGLLNSKPTSSFANGFKNLLKMLLDSSSGDLDTNPAGREALEAMQKAAADYLAAHPTKGKKPFAEADKQANTSGKQIQPKAPKPFEPGFLFGKPAEKVEVINSVGSSNDWIPHTSNDGWAPNETAEFLSGIKGKSGFGTAGPYISPFDPGYPVPLPTSNPSVHPSIFANQGPLTPTWGSSKSTFNPDANPKVDYDGNIDWGLVKSLNPGLVESPLDKIQNFDNYKGPYDYDSDEEDPDPAKRPSIASTIPVFPASDPNAQDQEDSMDIDMEHPDENTIEAGPDQEIIAEPEEKDTAPRKRARFAVGESSSQSSIKESAGIDGDASAGVGDFDADNLTDVKSPDEEMREYIRATHGLQLEELSLYLIPLRASILARALDLGFLRRLTLLSVGSQDPFWLLLTKLQQHSAHISFESIHTDHVSPAFLEFLRTFDSLQELFMLERNIKNEADVGLTKASVSITSIRKLALTKHIRTLQRLMIKNENDDTWDLDAKTIRFLSSRGAGLIEMAISLNMKHYHILIQQLPGFRNLVALQFFSLRVLDRSAVLQIESLTFAADTISHLPRQKIKYLALESHVTCIERKPDFVRHYMEVEKLKRAKGKGKGKAKMSESTNVDGSSDSDLADDISETSSMETRLRFGIEFWEIKGIKIFQKEMRTGRL